MYKRAISVFCAVAVLLACILPMTLINATAEPLQDNSEMDSRSFPMWNFNAYNSLADMGKEWTRRWEGDTGEGVTLSIETDTANVYQKSGHSLKMVYNRKKALYSSPRVWHEATVTTMGDGFTFWLKSNEDTSLILVCLDAKWRGITTGKIPISAGENIVTVKFSDFKFMDSTTGSPDLSKVSQLQICPVGCDTGTFWIDEIGFSNAVSVVDIPDTVVNHEDGFSEYKTQAAIWKNKTSQNATVALEQEAAHYHKNATNLAANTEALKISYSGLSSAAYNVGYYYNDRMWVSPSSPHLYGENTVLSFWTWSSQPMTLFVSYMDNSITKGQLIQCKDTTVEIPAGEAITKIAMKDLVPAGQQMDYTYTYQLQFALKANTDSVSGTGTLYMDAFGFYDAGRVVINDPQYLAENSYTWWDFDNYNTIEDMGKEWTRRWEGETGEGITLAIETDPANVYGGNGHSLKMTYDRSKGLWSSPCVWHTGLVTTYGDGITFWIKSKEKTKIDVVCLDAKYRGAKVADIPLEIGQNVVTVKYSDFVFMNAVPGETPILSSISQLQFHPSGCNIGTMWLDSVSYSNVVDDGTNSYKSINPPENYKSWEDGVKTVGDNFESWPGDDDMKFCAEWYFDAAGWISLEKNSDGNTTLRMDYNFNNGQTSVLKSCSTFKGVDPNGGISFWAKTSEERYYAVLVDLGGSRIIAVIKGSVTGRYYQIPFSEFWYAGNINKSYSGGRDLLNVNGIEMMTDNSYNPPAAAASSECVLWLDDISFVDSLAYKRAGSVNYYENGVRLIADSNAFSTGVNPKVEIADITAAEQSTYLSQMKQATGFIRQYNINAYNIYDISAIPERSVELIFDIPDRINAGSVQLYQTYIDGSVAKRSATVGEDGKLHASVYKLGSYIMAYGAAGGAVVPKTGDRTLFAIFATIAALSSAGMLIVLRSRRVLSRGGQR